MAIGVDRVRPFKAESPGQGGTEDDALSMGVPKPAEPQEDAIEVAGIYVQDEIDRDESVYIDRDGGELRFRDTLNTTPVTLSNLLSGGTGITESQHKALRDLIHFIDSGPADGFASSSYKENTYSGALLTSEIWYEDNTKVQKIVELTITYSGVYPATETWKMYDTDGTTVLVTVVDTISYSGAFESDVTRTWS